MQQHWYVLRSKPHKEDALNRYASQQGHEVFYPRIPVTPVNPGARRIRPYFPSYLFVRSDPNRVVDSTFSWMPFSQGLVHVGGGPVPVAEGFVRGLRARLDDIWAAGGLSSECLQKGDRVALKAGVFRGYEAIFSARLHGAERVSVLLKMLSDRYAPLELEARSIEKV